MPAFFGAPGIGERERERYLAGIDGLLFGDTAEEGFVRGRVFSHTGLGITFTAPAGARIENQPKAVIVTGPGEAATRFDAAAIDKRDTLTDYLRSGWINGLVEESIVGGQDANGPGDGGGRCTGGWLAVPRQGHTDRPAGLPVHHGAAQRFAADRGDIGSDHLDFPRALSLGTQGAARR